MNKWFQVEPMDTVWFRGGRPMVAGEDSYDPGSFPPSPWSFQGIVRTQILRTIAGPAGIDKMGSAAIEAEVGAPNQLPKGWEIHGPFPAHRNAVGKIEPWVPVPRFLWGTERNGKLDVRRARPWRTGLQGADDGPDILGQPTPWSSSYPWVGVERGDYQPLEGWISATNLAWAVQGCGKWNPKGYAHDLPPFVKREERYGVIIDSEKGKAQDHMLYMGVHHRFAPEARLVGRLKGGPGEKLRTGSVVSGRKQRLLTFVDDCPLDSTLGDLLDDKHLHHMENLQQEMTVWLWMSLLTPALVTADSQLPFDAAIFVQQDARLIGDLGIPGPVIGGFEHVAGRGRPARATWAAGSSWLFELKARDLKKVIDALRTPHSGKEYRSFGFGQRIFALFDPETGMPVDSKKATKAGTRV